MKKVLFIGLFSLVLGVAQAQEKGDLRLQAGGEFGFRSEFFGLNFGGEYLFTDQISAAPSFTIFFPEIGNASNLNLDFRYYFTEGALQWYGLAGFMNAWSSVNIPGFGQISSSTQGANLGAGGVLMFGDRIAFNPELKYQAQRGGQAVFKLGLVYFLN
ncbi:MAG: hypothetical protein JJU34_10530 [Lunatimonas sp.]|uniref:hypothetical protein n=1 Tax=Lunatimonas sp. TaxID=2060141 RepID=UPI00263BD81F|nr:hypothetical protein [Lunatimonas sp.]MCC5937709.1 hypothetical protein [Lunatimonas sp.]